MITGLPVTTWLLIISSFGIGLLIVLVSKMVNKKKKSSPPVNDLLGVIAVPFALAEVRVIFWFVLFAWSGLAASFAPVILCALFWKKTSLAGAVSGMLGGFLTTILWVVFFKAQFYDLYEMIPGFLAGAFFMVVVSLFSKPPENSRAEMESVQAALSDQ